MGLQVRTPDNKVYKKVNKDKTVEFQNNQHTKTQ
jgi:hypothetical protein